jgi:hypothetical protein
VCPRPDCHSVLHSQKDLKFHIHIHIISDTTRSGVLYFRRDSMEATRNAFQCVHCTVAFADGDELAGHECYYKPLAYPLNDDESEWALLLSGPAHEPDVGRWACLRISQDGFSREAILSQSLTTALDDQSRRCFLPRDLLRAQQPTFFIVIPPPVYQRRSPPLFTFFSQFLTACFASRKTLCPFLVSVFICCMYPLTAK